MQVQNNSSRGRPLNYNNRVDMHSFVYGSSHLQVNPTNPSQAVSMSIPQAMVVPPKPHFNVRSDTQTSLFDRYNKGNLYLRDCDERDLIQLNKNVVLHEQAISGELAENIARKSQQQRVRNSRIKQQCSSPGVYQQQQDVFLQTAPEVAPSKEFVRNEVFFNYKEMGDLKRRQKNDYLNAIELMVKDAENQIGQIEELQQQEKMEIGQIHQQQREIETQVNSAFRLGAMQQKIAAVTPLQQEDRLEVMHIHEEMPPREINEILDEHHRMNQDIVERANRARSGEKGKQKFGMSMTQGQKLGATMKKAVGPPKSIASTTKAGFKQGKNKK